MKKSNFREGVYMEKRKIKTSDIVKIALGAAVMCVLSAIGINLGPIPITLATFGVYVVGAVLGKYRAALSVLIYVALGALGLPVFAGFTGGISRLLWTGGGFIIGYIPCAFITGLIIDLAEEKRFVYPVSMVVGTLFCYGCGTLWYSFLMNVGFAEALTVCVVPFLIVDAVKIIIASFASYSIRMTVNKL